MTSRGTDLKSRSFMQRASAVTPGGVNSPVRAFKAVGGAPPFIESAAGSHMRDVDGNTYIDYVCSWGPLLFGHCPEFVTDALRSAIERGTSFGAATPYEVELAELVTSMVPSMEMVRFVNSGTEATASAIRLARGFTGRDKIIKCAGCYHGSVDSLLVSAGSGIATLGIPDTAGVPDSLAAETIVVEYNDVSALETVFGRFGSSIAALILEPIAGNMGLVLPAPGYLEACRELTHRHGAVLVFDEVISGFRAAPGGAQELYGIRPDLTCLGKIIGGGLPVGAYGGRRDIVEKLAPLGPVYQAGTLSGNPLAMASGTAMLHEIRKRGSALYDTLEQTGAALADGLLAAACDARVEVTINRLGSLMTVFFSPDAVRDYRDACRADTAAFARFFGSMLRQGVYLPPSQFECLFVSTAHTAADISCTLRAAAVAMSEAATTASRSD